MRVRRFRVPVDQIAYVRMIVDGYDGLAVVTTPAGAGSSIVQWWIAPGREQEADTLAIALRAECRLENIEAGDDADTQSNDGPTAG